MNMNKLTINYHVDIMNMNKLNINYHVDIINMNKLNYKLSCGYYEYE